eukprot:Platyproteum_vivax@DN6978_c0_g1_i12.p1
MVEEANTRHEVEMHSNLIGIIDYYKFVPQIVVPDPPEFKPDYRAMVDEKHMDVYKHICEDFKTHFDELNEKWRSTVAVLLIEYESMDDLKLDEAVTRRTYREMLTRHDLYTDTMAHLNILRKATIHDDVHPDHVISSLSVAKAVYGYEVERVPHLMTFYEFEDFQKVIEKDGRYYKFTTHYGHDIGGGFILKTVDFATLYSKTHSLYRNSDMSVKYTTFDEMSKLLDGVVLDGIKSYKKNIGNMVDLAVKEVPSNFITFLFKKHTSVDAAAEFNKEHNSEARVVRNVGEHELLLKGKWDFAVRLRGFHEASVASAHDAELFKTLEDTLKTFTKDAALYSYGVSFNELAFADVERLGDLSFGLPNHPKYIVERRDEHFEAPTELMSNKEVGKFLKILSKSLKRNAPSFIEECSIHTIDKSVKAIESSKSENIENVEKMDPSREEQGNVGSQQEGGEKAEVKKDQEEPDVKSKEERQVEKKEQDESDK